MLSFVENRVHICMYRIHLLRRNLHLCTECLLQSDIFAVIFHHEAIPQSLHGTRFEALDFGHFAIPKEV